MTDKTQPRAWTPPTQNLPKNEPSGIKVYRLYNKRTYLWVAARDEEDARKLADRVCDDFVSWSIAYAGAHHDHKATSRGVLTHEKVLALFAMPRVPVRTA